MTQLREVQRVKSRNATTRISENDIVIIQEEKQPRHLWGMGQVTSLITGRDGQMRGATVKVGKIGSNINRRVNRLYPLETMNNDKEQLELRVTNTRLRPMRQAAIIGEIKRNAGEC